MKKFHLLSGTEGVGVCGRRGATTRGIDYVTCRDCLRDPVHEVTFWERSYK